MPFARLIWIVPLAALLLCDSSALGKSKKAGGPTLTVSASPLNISEGQAALFTVRASSPVTAPITFGYIMTGTAHQGTYAGAHYTLRGGSVINVGSTSTTVTLVASRTGLTSGSEAAVMTLIKGPGYKVAGGKKAPHATVTINNVVAMSEIEAPFEPFHIVRADPLRNLVYTIDLTTARLIALDTATGQIAAASAFEQVPTPADPRFDKRFSDIAISVDGSKLYLALPQLQQIRVFSLPNLAPLATLPIDFKVYRLATTLNDRLFASCQPQNPGSSTDGSIREIDTSNGAVRQIFAQEQCGGLCGCPNCYFYPGTALLRTNLAGTRLYATEAGVYVEGGPQYIFEFDVTGPSPILLHRYPFANTGLANYAVDEQQRRIYTVCGGIYGVQLTDMTTDAYGAVWWFNSSYATDLAFLPNDNAIWAASADEYYGEIRQFRRSDGAWLNDYVVGTDTKTIQSGTLAITPNQRLVYVSNLFTGCDCAFGGFRYFVGLIGKDTLTLNNAPSDGGNMPNPDLTAVNFADSEGNSDGAPNAGEIISFAPTLTNRGTLVAPNVTIEASVDSGATCLECSRQSAGSVVPGAGVTAAPFRFQLASDLQPGSTVRVTFTIHWDFGVTELRPYTVVIR